MNNKLSTFDMGTRILSKEEAAKVDLGPLAGLQGKWVSKPKPAMGWNVIAVPGPTSTQGFTLEVIPYEETLTFTPVVTAGNRGPFVDGVQQDQSLAGLMYEQVIHSVCDTDLCKKMGFGVGTEIHAERGIFLHVKNLNSNFEIARLSTIPHGNSVLALGTSVVGVPPDNNFFGKAPIAPRPVPGGKPLGLGYGEFQYEQNPQFPGVFDQSDPNTFLRKTLGNDKLTAMTTLIVSTKNKDGGILNIPFIENNVDATALTAVFWIETIMGANQKKFDQLQYTQTIDLVFPPTGFNQPIIWPHVTVNTLRKVK